MSRLDKNAIKAGVFLVGGNCPGTVLDTARPPRYGQPAPPRAPTLVDLAERTDALRRKIEAVAQTLRQARR